MARRIHGCAASLILTTVRGRVAVTPRARTRRYERVGRLESARYPVSRWNIRCRQPVLGRSDRPPDGGVVQGLRAISRAIRPARSRDAPPAARPGSAIRPGGRAVRPAPPGRDRVPDRLHHRNALTCRTGWPAGRGQHPGAPGFPGGSITDHITGGPLPVHPCPLTAAAPPRRECARRGLDPIPPPNREDRTMTETVDQAQAQPPRTLADIIGGRLCASGRTRPQSSRTAAARQHGRSNHLPRVDVALSRCAVRRRVQHRTRTGTRHRPSQASSRPFAGLRQRGNCARAGEPPYIAAASLRRRVDAGRGSLGTQ